MRPIPTVLGTKLAAWRLALRDRGARAFSARFRSDYSLHLVMVADVLGLALSIGVYVAVARYWDRPDVQLALDTLGDNRRLLVQNDLGDFSTSVEVLAGYFEGLGDRPDRARFEHLADRLDHVVNQAGLVGWVPLVSHEERTGHESLAAVDGVTGYRISDLAPRGGLVPAGDRSWYFPLLFARGNSKLKTWVGLDLGSNAGLRDTLDRARDQGRLTASGLVRMSTVSSSPPLFVLVAPVYLPRLPHDSVEGRRRNLAGFAAGLVIPGTLLDSSLRRVSSPQGLDVQFFEAGAGPDDLAFHVRSSLLRTAPAAARTRAELEAGMHWTGHLDFGGAQWDMVVVPIPNGPLFGLYNRAWIALLFGFLLTGATVTYAWLVHRVTARLRRTQGQLAIAATIAENSSVALGQFRFPAAGIGPEGPAPEYISENVSQFGYRAQDLVSGAVNFFTDVVHPADRSSLVASMMEAVAKRETVRNFEFRLVRKDGETRWVEGSMRFYRDASAAIVRGQGILRDITERKLAVAAIGYRSALLHAVAAVAADLVTNSSIDDAIVRALNTVGEAVHVDGVLVLEAQHSNHLLPPIYRYGWNSPAARVILDASSFAITDTLDLGWIAPLAKGQPITARVGESGGGGKLLKSLGIKSILVVPLMIDGKYWGQISFSDCSAKREWSAVEIDILRTLADIVATSIIRARYVKELTDANMIVQNSPTILYRMAGEPALPMIYVSRNVALLGYDAGAMVASPQLYKNYIHPEDQEKVREVLVEAVKPASGPGVTDFRLRTADGRYRWMESRYTPVRDKAGRLIEIEGIMIDITERKAAEEKISLLARTDALTGLANRATFGEHLRQAFAAARRGASGFAVLYLDLDHFKNINDTLGHPIGDLLLKAVAERLTGSVRETDLVARLGGDEFAVLQTELPDIAGAGALAEKVRAALAAPYPIAGNEVHITTSVGIAPYAAETEEPDDMLAQADLALYRAKEEGRDQFRFHSEILDHQVRERTALANDLRHALDCGELELYYQPQVEISSGRIVGMEALIRWNHPTRGLLRPAAFLPIAEKTGMIVALGHWVLDRACEQMHCWREAGVAPPTLAVNLSLAQLKTGQEFVAEVTRMLTRWELTPIELELDVTESMLAHATLAQNDVLDRLQKLGVRIAIDDFGTQYSSLDYLKAYHVSRLKIPQKMVNSAPYDAGNAAMVRAIMGIARELDVEVIAQGMETEAQRSFLGTAGATAKGQGYYYSEPVPADRATEILRAKQITPRVKAVAG